MNSARELWIIWEEEDGEKRVIGIADNEGKAKEFGIRRKTMWNRIWIRETLLRRGDSVDTGEFSIFNMVEVR